jgi:hypothetical protein
MCSGAKGVKFAFFVRTVDTFSPILSLQEHCRWQLFLVFQQSGIKIYGASL